MNTWWNWIYFSTSITIVGGGGSGATATASVRGPIQSVGITVVVNHILLHLQLVLSSGSGAVAQAIVKNGRIISIAIISAGLVIQLHQK